MVVPPRKSRSKTVPPPVQDVSDNNTNTSSNGQRTRHSVFSNKLTLLAACLVGLLIGEYHGSGFLSVTKMGGYGFATTYTVSTSSSSSSSSRIRLNNNSYTNSSSSSTSTSRTKPLVSPEDKEKVKQELQEKIETTLQKEVQEKIQTMHQHEIDTKHQLELDAVLQIQTQRNATHASSIDLLGLQDWEQQSLDALVGTKATNYTFQNVCTPPDGIATTCCPGTFSSGGGVNLKLRHQCAAHGFDQWEEQQTLVKSFFRDHPIQNTKTNTATTATTATSTSIMQCDACQIAELAYHNNLNITMIGDSMQSQIYEGLKCELSRRGYLVEQTNMGYPGPKDTYIDFASITTLTITSPLWNQDQADSSATTTTTTTTNSITLTYYMLYLMPLSDHSAPLMNDILSNTQVLMLGMGLHWKSGNHGGGMAKQGYAPAIVQVIQQAYATNDTNSSSAVELIVHRETSAQHFDIPGGDYKEWFEDKSRIQGQCVPAIQGPNSKWREQALQNATKEAGYNFLVASSSMPAYSTPKKDVVALPFYDLTERLHSAHPGADCTHYCSSPFLYMTLWRSMRLAMDRQYSL